MIKDYEALKNLKRLIKSTVLKLGIASLGQLEELFPANSLELSK